MIEYYKSRTMVKINITGTSEINDPFYRYKRDKVEITTEKNKTVIINLDKICEDLNRDQSMVVTFLKKHFGGNITYKNLKYYSTKKLTIDFLEEALGIFTESAVLCPECRLPETVLIFEKDLKISCNCCGNVNKINISKINSKALQGVFDMLMKVNNSKKKKKQ